jgi:hypothetical protein
MKKKHAILLTIDGIINLALGILLLLFPLGMAELLGVPKSNVDFYPTILGAVIFGIGIALLIERYGFSRNIRGLGLGGAIAINLCGAIALLIWLVSTPLNIPLRGYVILWSIVIIVLVVGIVEILAKSWHYKD